MLRFLSAAALCAGVALAAPIAQAEKVLRVGMSAADIPLTTGNPDQGFEGFRFMGYMVYDALVLWDLSSADRPSTLMPGLATEWKVDDNDKRRWIFKLRQGVKYHDGSEFQAEDVKWNFDKVTKSSAPHYDSKQAAQVLTRIPDITEVEVIDRHTVAIVTGQPTANIPYEVSFWFLSSPSQYRKLGSWEKFANEPSGTGPWKLAGFVPRQRAEMLPNKEYWEPKRVPKLDRVVLLPVPEASARTAGLLSGQLDWIEAPSPDTIARLKSSGKVIVTNAYPHNWAIAPSRAEGSPWNDIRVRKAANLCIDRDGINEVLGGLSIPAKGHVVESDTWFGSPGFKLGYRPDEARKLMAEAGFSKQNPRRVKIAISTSGSGQMQPLPMFEALQSNLNDCFFKVEAEVMEWNALTTFGREQSNSPKVKATGVDSIIISRATQDPFSAFDRLFLSNRLPPAGSNWGMVNDPEYDALLTKASQSFEVAAQNAVLRQFHEKLVDKAEWIWVTHDVNPRALASNVKGFVQAQSWFQDLTPVTVE